jgi:hypothetical protein
MLYTAQRPALSRMTLRHFGRLDRFPKMIMLLVYFEQSAGTGKNNVKKASANAFLSDRARHPLY